MCKIIFNILCFGILALPLFAQEPAGKGNRDSAALQKKNAVLLDSTCPPLSNFNLAAVPPLFSTSTMISIKLIMVEDITIRIYDIAGRLVRTIVSTGLTIGVHRYFWNGTSDDGSLLPSGFYTCIASGMGHADFVKLDLVR